MVTFNSVIAELEKAGLADVIIPFILIFAVSFAVMEKVKIFANKKTKEDGTFDKFSPGGTKKYNAVVALVISLTTVIAHVTNSYPDPKYDVVNIINNAIPHVSVVVVGLVCLLILMSSLGFTFKVSKKQAVPLNIIMWGIGLATVGYIFASAAGVRVALPNWLSFLADGETQLMILIVVGFGLIISYIMKEDKKDEIPADADGNKDYAGYYKGVNDKRNARLKRFIGR